MKQFAKYAFFVFLLLPLQFAFATDDMDILRDKIKADKKLLVATNMDLTESESKAFWPVYESYQTELAVINQRILKLVESYAKDYTAGTLTDDAAAALITESIAIDQAEVDLKKSYVPKLEAALPKIKVARYLQVENKIRGALKYEILANVPLAE